MPSPTSLDSKKNNCNRACGNRVAVGTVEQDGKRFAFYARIYCKRWKCPYCGPRRASELVRSIAKEAKEKGLSRLLTLTLDPKKIGDADPFQLIRDTWRKFRVYLKRELGGSPAFIAIMERHKSGLPHLHVLLDQYVRQAWISASWDRLGGGRIAHIEHVADLDRVGWYLGKYLAKDALLGLPPGMKRFTCSRGIKLRERVEPGSWKLLDGTMEAAIRRHNRQIAKEIRDADGNVKAFLVPQGLDSSAKEAASDEPPARKYGPEDYPPGFGPEEWELLWTGPAGEGYDAWRDLCEGVEQGASGRGVFDPGPDEAA